ncbi:MAG TPA: ABC transporter permease [Vicinamibacterales bacterium]
MRFAIRNLLRTPGFTLVAIATLALGIGANTAIFSIVNGVVLRPLAYPEPDRLVFITSQFPALGFAKFWVSPPEYLELAERQRTFERIGAYTTGQVNLTAPDRPRRVTSASVTGSLLEALGVQPQRGRLFSPQDEVTGAAPVAILSHDLWVSSFGADPGLVGRTIEVEGQPRTVVGIMPRGYDLGDERVELWQPLVFDANARTRRGSHFLYLVGRLAPGRTLQDARAELETLLAQWRQTVPEGHVPSTTEHRLQYESWQDEIVGGARRAVWVLQAAVAFVLLIACANLANLFLARSEGRQREFATRLALGATRTNLLGQFVTEGLVLTGAGAAVGVVLAWFAVPALLAVYQETLPRATEVSVDLGALLFTAALTLLTGFVFGLAPLFHLREGTVSQTLREGSSRTTGGSATHRVRRLLVGAEVALAVVLVAGAGLMLQTLWNLARIDAGFDRRNLVTFGLSLPQSRYPDPVAVTDLYERLLGTLRQLPGVTSAAAMSGLPPLRDVNANDTDIDGYTAPPNGPFENVDFYQVATAGYVETLGIPVVDGRAFTEADALGPPVVLINETMAKTFWKDRSAIGGRIRPPSASGLPWFTVVGIVKDVKQGGVDQKTGTEIYFNAAQAARVAQFAPRTMHIVLRTALPPEALDGPIRQMIQQIDPTLPIVNLRTMEDVFAESTRRTELLARLLGGFGLLALLLAALGTYGVLSYIVSERRREIGIRMALGAERRGVLALVMRQGAVMAGAGLVVGVAGVLLLDRVLGSLLFGVTASDPRTIAAVVLALGLTAALACYLPARRATRLDPMVVLRED